MKDKESILEYFAGKASRYDEVDKQVYWRLSDQLLWHLLSQKVIEELPEEFTFLDAGGGTGRWSEKVLREYGGSKAKLIDLSPHMLEEAEKKAQAGLSDRFETALGNIEELSQVPDNTFDLAFNFHNVLGFVSSPETALRELSRVTKPDGIVVSVVPSQYHTVFFNLKLNRLDEAEIAARESRGRFTTDMPYMNLFSIDSLHELYGKAGISNIEVYGFPVCIYPGFAETQIEGSTQSIEDILDDKAQFDRIYEIEKSLSVDPSAAARGNNLFVMGRVS